MGVEEERGFRSMRGGALVLASTLAMWIVCAIALYIYAGEGRDPRRYDLVIHKGTDELVAAGQNPLALPSHWNLRSGDVLVLDNREDSQQTFGAWSVGPGELREVVLRPFTGLVQCTLHPEGELVLDVAPAVLCANRGWTPPRQGADPPRVAPHPAPGQVRPAPLGERTRNQRLGAPTPWARGMHLVWHCPGPQR